MRTDLTGAVVKRAEPFGSSRMISAHHPITTDNRGAKDTQTADERSSGSGRNWFLVLIVSAGLVIPCFWHSHLEAGDLGSHVYNAWLAWLIHEGKAPGLTIVTQWNNVLFDFLLSDLGHFFNLLTAARIASAIGVLVFFWGAFSFVYSAAGRIAWLLSPLLAAIAYGWAFNAGLSNYYISMGLAFWALAIVNRGWGRYWLALLALLPLMYVAHPLGICWALAAGVYIFAAKHIPRKSQVVLFGGSLCAIIGVRFYLLATAVTKPPSHSAIFYNGLDQIFFTNRYAILVALLWCLILTAFGLNILWRRGAHDLTELLIPLQLYLLVEAGVQLLPDSILLKGSVAQFSELTDRLTLISAVLLCVLLACAMPPRWLLGCLAAVATVFFIFLYQDTGVIDRMENEAETLVHRTPQGQRVVATIDPPLKYRFQLRHIIDLACLDYCYAYGNYEPATHQFRVRASEGNQFMVSRVQDSLEIDAGTYVVPPNASPLFQLYDCGPPWTKLCIRQREAGDTLSARVKIE